MALWIEALNELAYYERERGVREKGERSERERERERQSERERDYCVNLNWKEVGIKINLIYKKKFFLNIKIDTHEIVTL